MGARSSLGLGLIALAVLAGSIGAETPPLPRAEIPIREVIQSNGRRYTVPIKVGDTTIEAGLDTGSTGLRILPKTLGAADAAASKRGDHYGYGSGADLRGVIGHGVLRMGEVAGDTTFQLVATVGCRAEKPNCPAIRVPLEQFGIQGDGHAGEGFRAIMGVNMAEADVASPLRAIGAKRWIVELPRPGETAPGRLILNPTDAEAAGYAMIPVLRTFADRGGGLHDAVSACLVNGQNKAKTCGALLMDTGARGLRVVNGDVSGPPWPDGSAATLAFYDGSGRPKAVEQITIGLARQASHLDFEKDPRRPASFIYAGLTPYFAFSVLYDPAKGEVGLKVRPPAPGGPLGLLAGS